ncbi:ABC transporter substrate-binding protein [Rhodospirillales bacterium]|nr:ABC transporter substrate-binding protein [Rhodospirillales bacterium]
MKLATRAIVALVTLSTLLISVHYASVRADDFTDGAEQFIVSLADDAISSLTSETLTEKERQKQFRVLLNSYFDINGIGKWALGRYWRKTSESERSEYLVLFENLIVSTYANRFSQYTKEKLTVKGSSSRGKFALVKSQINGGKEKPIRIEWRVIFPDGNYKIFDIVVEGVSMVRTQRSEFSSVIRRNGGKISVLLAALRKKTNKSNQK